MKRFHPGRNTSPGSDACRRETYLKRNVEISRIMMGD
jgi:hypothetical protein